MPYKQSLVVVIVLLLASALAVAYRFLPNPQASNSAIDSTNKIHSTLYRDAQKTWQADLTATSLESSSRLRLTWNKPEQSYNHFLLTVTATDYDSPWTRTESGEQDRVSLDVSELPLDTAFTFVVQACLDPNCATWIIADQEAGARTEKQIWVVNGKYTKYPQGKLIPYTFDLSDGILHEEWEGNMSPRMDITWPKELKFPLDAKSQVSVLEVDMTTLPQQLIIEQILNGKTIIYGAVLKNP